jgi:methylmalonyl-CoA/ethylmalonyl-CoA epimerase
MEIDLPDLGAQFDHVAVAAPRIRDLLPIYRDLLGGTYYKGGDNVRVGYRALQLSYANGRNVELMEPLAGSTFFDRFFARTGGGGLHHITFLVDDLEQAIAAVEALGYTPTNPYLENPAWREVFLHPKQALGTLLQLVQTTGSRLRPSSIEEILAGTGPGGNGTPSP